MLGNYLKMAWRVLSRRKFFTFVSLFGISFTLTTLMVTVALVDHTLSPSYPEIELDRMLHLERMDMFGDRSHWSSSPGYKFIDTYARDLPGVQRMSVYTGLQEATTFVNGRKLQLKSRYADEQFWQIMQFSFLAGAAFTGNDNQNARRVAVITADTRQQFFGDQEAVGKSLQLNGLEYQVVGVVENVPFYRQHSSADIWLPLNANLSVGFLDRMMGGCNASYLLEPDATAKEVQAAFTERLTRIVFDDPERFHTATGLPMTELELYSSKMLNLGTGEMAPRRLVVIGLLGILVFMGLPAINLVNINLSRISERSAEIGVRKAFGAASADLVLQFVTENVVLSLIGGALSLVGVFLMMQVAPMFPQLPFLSFELNWRIFGAALAMATVFGLLSGVWPAWRMSRQHPVTALKGGQS